MDISFALFAVMGFLAVVLALEGLYNVWASKRSAQAVRISERLAALRGEIRTEVSLERVQRKSRLPALQALLDRMPIGARLSTWVRASGMQVTAGELAIVSIGLGALGLLLPGMIGKPPVFGLSLAVVLACLPWFRVGRRRAKRIERFELQFPEALDLMARAMRAGHAFPTAIKMVGDEMSEPMGRDFRILSDEMNYGVPAQEALLHMAERVPLADVSYFVVAVMIQRESGGNLAELLDKISAIVRQRLKLLGEIRTLSAEGRMSAMILTALPFGVALMINLVNPEFMRVLFTDELGQHMLGGAMFMMAIGIVWMKKIIKIRV